MKQKNSYRAVGVMSGTSLDGLDVVLCDFICKEGTWDFTILKCNTVMYSDEQQNELASAQSLSAYDFVALHRKYGKFIGGEVAKFAKNETNIDLVASHGHTVFHEPDKQVTFQVGCGAQIAAACNLTVVSDFRTLDIALGGQGAPLVPIGDELLFGKYDACVNLGGFANISYEQNGVRTAFDICAVNIVINEIVSDKFGLAFDKSGDLGASGLVNEDLLQQLNNLDFYNTNPPKSLAREWVETVFKPILYKYDHIDTNDLLATCYHHFAQQIAKVLDENKVHSSLFTGGGTFNNYLMRLISEYSNTQIIIPDKEVIDFKEAVIFAFLGVLRIKEQDNCLSSVTGARKNNVGGSVFV